MSYSFDFDLTKVSRSFFQKVADFTERKELHHKVGKIARKLTDEFGIDRATGMNFSDAITLMEDLVEINVKNLSNRKKFEKSDERALLLPHCSRKYMDDRCEANFDPELSSYECKGCSDDCLVNKAKQKGEKEGYDVYVFPGGSCVSKLIRKKNYDGMVGVACSEEIKLGGKKLDKVSMPYQGLPLLKNGCANTRFNLKTLKEIL